MSRYLRSASVSLFIHTHRKGSILQSLELFVVRSVSVHRIVVLVSQSLTDLPPHGHERSSTRRRHFDAPPRPRQRANDLPRHIIQKIGMVSPSRYTNPARDNCTDPNTNFNMYSILYNQSSPLFGVAKRQILILLEPSLGKVHRVPRRPRAKIFINAQPPPLPPLSM